MACGAWAQGWLPSLEVLNSKEGRAGVLKLFRTL